MTKASYGLTEDYDKKYRSKEQGVFTLVLLLVAVLIVLFFLLRFVVGTSRVDGSSMDPTLIDGQMIIFTRIHASYDAGDIVCLSMPNGDNYVKRVVAVPGDVVELKEGKLYVNGVVADSFGHGQTLPQEASISYPYTLEKNKYFLLGDNRENSVDSRSFGAVYRGQILGKVIHQ